MHGIAPGPYVDRARLEVNEAASLDVHSESVGDDHVLVIDHLYCDPDYVRGLALALDFVRPAGGYPGRLACMSIWNAGLIALLRERVSELFGTDIGLHPAFPDLTFGMVMVKAGDLRPINYQPHHDTFCDFAGIVYLNTDEQCSGGTSFWRHRATGLQAFPRDDDPELPGLLQRYDATDGRQLVERMLGEAVDSHRAPLLGSTSTWEMTKLVEMRFNRLILYPGRLFHTMHLDPEAFGDTPATRRLTQNLYLVRSA